MGACPVCGKQFELAQKSCPTHKAVLIPIDPRSKEALTVFDASVARTEVDRERVVSVTQPTRPVDATLLEPGLANRTDEPEITPIEADLLGPTTARRQVNTWPENDAADRNGRGPVRTGLASPFPEKLPGAKGSSHPSLATVQSIIGHMFDGYITTGVLAEGGMGLLYEAQHPILGTQAVVKVLKKILTGDPVSQRRMLTEGQTLSALTHRNVVRVFGFGYLADGRPWLLMERLVGESLFTLLKSKGKLSPDEAVPLMRQMAAGLESTHALGVVHRDLKPDNLYVVVEPDGERLVKLIDFGIARPDVSDGPVDARTAIGRFVGTPAYGAPELFLGAPCSQASDVYALGCVFFEMLTGTRPFKGSSLGELTQMHHELRPPDVSTIVPTIEPGLDALIRQMLAKRVTDRPTIEEVRARLEPAHSPRQPVPLPPSSQIGWWLVVAVVAVGLGLGLGLLLRGQTSRPSDPPTLVDPERVPAGAESPRPSPSTP
jgi:serine/threonine protein kinase